MIVLHSYNPWKALHTLFKESECTLQVLLTLMEIHEPLSNNRDPTKDLQFTSCRNPDKKREPSQEKPAI